MRRLKGYGVGIGILDICGGAYGVEFLAIGAGGYVLLRGLKVI